MEGDAGAHHTIRGASGGSASDLGKSLLPSNSAVLTNALPARAEPVLDFRQKPFPDRFYNERKMISKKC
jgi:hypothetical protein